MLVRFSVQNFGSIKDKQTLSFEADKSKHLEDYYVIETNGLRLLKLGLIFGANASGKTTILKALEFLRTLVYEPAIIKSKVFEFEPFKFDEKTPLQNTFFEIEFIQNDTRYLYHVELNKNAIVSEELYSYNPKKYNVFIRTTDLGNQATKINFGNKTKINENTKNIFEQVTLWNNTVLGGFLKFNLVSKELKDAIDWFASLQKPITSDYCIKVFFESETNITELEKHTIVDMLRKADFNISNFYFRDTTTLDIDFEHTVNNKKYFLDYNLQSIGTQRYYTFVNLLLLLIKNSVFVSIDELESSLHPDLFIHFLLSFLTNSKKSQIIATTHNREILNNKDIFRNDAIWITDKGNANCATELYSLADFDTKVIRDTTNIYNAYKFGKLGGVPHLSDYYIDIENDEKK